MAIRCRPKSVGAGYSPTLSVT